MSCFFLNANAKLFYAKRLSAVFGETKGKEPRCCTEPFFSFGGAKIAGKVIRTKSFGKKMQEKPSYGGFSCFLEA